ncbi:MAG: SCO family protein [Betaproteobacteria bacterium]|nr:SCO family protein [Betaproteobacteria bacterium]
MRRRSMIGSCLLVIAIVAGGCGQPDTRPQFKLTDVTGANLGRELNLLDHNGRPRALADFQGKVVVIFFGFAQCPDVCPTTLSELAAVARELGKDADRMQVLFVTVDPERDTQEVLRQYVPSFDPRFLGLYGDAEATARAAKAFKIFYQKQPLKDSTTYSVDHSAGTYILDREGRLRLYARYGAGAALLLHDIRILLDS